MKASDLFKQYVWLTDTIYRAGEISFQEINGLWVKTVMSNGIPMGRTTFNRCRTAIEEIFNLNIECKKKDVYVYYIENKDILKNNSIQHWMLDSLSVSNMLLESISMKEYILLENIPSGRKHLHTIINGMKLKCKLALEYKKFGREKAHNITVAPYAVKVFKQRWYLLANDGKWDVPAVYALDCIISLEMTHQPYEYPKGFDAENFFKDCYVAQKMWRKESSAELIHLTLTIYVLCLYMHRKKNWKTQLSIQTLNISSVLPLISNKNFFRKAMKWKCWNQ